MWGICKLSDSKKLNALITGLEMRTYTAGLYLVWHQVTGYPVLIHGIVYVLNTHVLQCDVGVFVQCHGFDLSAGILLLYCTYTYCSILVSY